MVWVAWHVRQELRTPDPPSGAGSENLQSTGFKTCTWFSEHTCFMLTLLCKLFPARKTPVSEHLFFSVALFRGDHFIGQCQSLKSGHSSGRQDSASGATFLAQRSSGAES